MGADILIYHYSIVLVTILATIWAIKRIFSKVVLKPENAHPSKRQFMREHTRRFNIIGRIVLGVFVCISISLIIIPSLWDLPRVFQKNYCIEYLATADTNTVKEGIRQKRDINFIMPDGRKQNITVFSEGYYEGQTCLIYYLPHAKIGTIKKWVA